MDQTQYNQQVTALRERIEKLYAERGQKALFHGIHHIRFVAHKAREFAEALQANSFLCESAALVHDINYLIEQNSAPERGVELRKQILSECQYSPLDQEAIENIILEEHTGNRGKNISKEAMALSDADTLFKALPITPILFTGKYIQENSVDIKQLAHKIITEQRPLFDAGIYFYTDSARERYLKWAQTNLELWENVYESLSDLDVQRLLSDMA